MIGLTPEELEIVRLSLKVAFWSTVASLPVALALAMLLARGRFPGKALVDGDAAGEEVEEASDRVEIADEIDDSPIRLPGTGTHIAA